MLDDQPTSDPTDEVDTSHEAHDAAPEPGHAATDQHDVDYAKRYNDLRPEFDRTKQELAEHRRLVEALSADDPDTRRHAAEALGLQLIDDDEPEDDTFDLDPAEQLRREFEEFRNQYQTEREKAEQQAAQEREIDHVHQQVLSIESDLGRELDEQELKLLAGYASVNRDEHGLPDVKSAWELFTGVVTQDKKRWATSKKAPPVSPAGKSATKQPDLNTRSERLDHMLERLNASES